QKVFVDILKIIEVHHIKRLLKSFDMRTQILFEYHLKEWRALLGCPLGICNTQRHVISSALPPQSQTTTCSSSIQIEPYSVQSLTPESNETNINLSTVLNETTRGVMLTSYYTNFGKFNEEQRSMLINVIAQYLEDKKIQMSLSKSYQLERQILETFPTEKLEYYRTSKRGKLYNKCANLKSSIKSTIPSLTNKEKGVSLKQTQKQTLIPDADVESCIRSMKYDNLSTEEFDHCWKGCAQYRLAEIKNLQSTEEIFNKWPYYKLASGYRLIDMDFNMLYTTGDSLMTKWKANSEKIFDFISSDNHIKDKEINKCLRSAAEGKLTENSRDAVIFWALHGYFVPTAKVTRKDSSGRKSVTKFTIKDSQESFVFVGKSHQQIEEHVRHLKTLKESTIQPFILCVGNDITSVKDIYLYFNDIKYSFCSFLHAVDICFKLCYVFDLSFPSACTMFWNFIESFFFEIKSKSSFSKVHVLTETLKAAE
ncbi:hypothetical protein ILUMI_18715, partial [Ignelater luminosus]